MRDRGIGAYHGFDFSPKRIDQARRICPEFTFSVQDATTTDLFTTVNYDTILCTEFLEHVEGDLAVLSRIKRGARFLGTVPNLPFTSHVRHFGSAGEVLDRYGNCLEDLRVDALLANPDGRVFFLLNGRTRCQPDRGPQPASADSRGLQRAGALRRVLHRSHAAATRGHRGTILPTGLRAVRAKRRLGLRIVRHAKLANPAPVGRLRAGAPR
jgi:hypothetical protein